MPRPATTLARALLGAGALALLAPPLALGASRTATLEGWHDVHAAFAGRSLVVSDAAPVRLDPRRTPGPRVPGATSFVYYRVETNVAELDGPRLRFRAAPEEQLSVRTSIAAMTSGSLGTTTSGRYLLVPGSGRFPAPVVHCCDDDEIETVLQSTSREDAPRPLAGTLLGARRALWLSRAPDGALTLDWADPTDLGARGSVPLDIPPPDVGLLSLGPGLLAYARDADPTSLVVARVSDEGAFGARPIQLRGRIVGVAAEKNIVAVAIRAGSGHEVHRLRWPSLSPERVWRGRARPMVAVGGGSVAAATRGAAYASRRGELEEIRTAQGRISAIAVDRTRAAVLERRRVKRKPATVARLWRVPA